MTQCTHASWVIAVTAAVAVLTTVSCTERGSAAQSTDAPPDCGAGQGMSGSRATANVATSEARQVESSPSIRSAAAPVVLRTLADIPMPGGTVRFDYQSLDDSAGRLYLSHMNAAQLTVFDTRSRQVITTVHGLPGLTGVLVVPELDRVYASVTGHHNVAVIDTKTFRVIATVGTIGFPDGIAYAANMRKVFVSDESGGGELVIDAQHDTAIGKIPIGGEAGNTIYDAASGCILVAVQTRNQVIAIDPRSERVIGRYAFAGADHPHGLHVDVARRRLFIANQGNATLLEVDLRTMQVTSHQRVGDDPDVLALDPTWHRLYAASESGVVAVFDERGDTLVRAGRVTMPNAHTVAVSPRTHLVYIPLKNMGGRPVLRIMEATPPATSER